MYLIVCGVLKYFSTVVYFYVAVDEFVIFIDV